MKWLAKWKEKSMFYKIVEILLVCCALAYVVLGVFYFAGNLPGFAGNSWDRLLASCFWLCEGILDWKTSRGRAVLFYVLALGHFIMAITDWLLQTAIN